jgi:hypothetical protein
MTISERLRTAHHQLEEAEQDARLAAEQRRQALEHAPDNRGAATATATYRAANESLDVARDTQTAEALTVIALELAGARINR